MSIKTAISLEDELFQKIDTLSKELQISRSRLFALAVQEFIVRHENLHLLEAINLAYSDDVDTEEKALEENRHSQQRHLLDTPC